MPHKSNPIANAVEEIAEEQLGVDDWDRPAIYRETAEAATDDRLPYWLVLVISAAIATLGLALNSSAVVIGAMLVAPLLAPIMGLALALAVGDGRLAVQTAAVVLGSVAAVLAAAALLTLALPFQTITLEISARTRPTTLDLAIAVFSGLVAAVVVVARGNRISAAIPGVAISVALIPPLAVAGFGLGAGISRELVFGSLLLFGANLAGIVLSGVAVFLLVGLHRRTVVETARAWHGEEHPTGLAGWVDRFDWVRRIAVFSSPRARVGLVLAFVAALAVPLTVSLREIARETRVESAISEAADSLFDVRDRASIINRQVVYGSDRTQVYLRVATTSWFGQADRAEFERRASARAGEPVRLSLEQLPARGEDIEQLAALIPGATGRPVRPPPPPSPTGIGELLVSARLRLQQAMDALALPSGMTVAGMELGTSDAGDARLRVFYASTDSLSSQAREMLELQITRALDVPEMELVLDHLSTRPRELDGGAGEDEVLHVIAELLADHDRLRVELLGPESMRAAAVATVQRLVERGVPGDRIRLVITPGDGLRARVAVALPAPAV
jgi:uncharacterized hydrophobic protein (TIGR00271 family)